MCSRTRSGQARPRLRGTRATSRAAAVLALLAGASAARAEPCTLHRLGELPVTMESLRPLVHAAINGSDALFIADSGAFFNTLTPAAAQQFKLRLEALPEGFVVRGIGGETRAWLTNVKTFTIFGIGIANVPFIVAGNDLGQGAVGLLGQNVFRLGDVEYDLANGIIRILKPHGDCRRRAFAYWAANDQPYSETDIEFATAASPHTTGSAYLNGRRIHVLFDTGAATSVMTLDTARRAGITPDSPGVSAGGTWYGIGHRLSRSWIAPFASFRIGDEEIRNTRLRLAETALPGVDMLIGADFFLSHRVYVASSQHKLYFTYNGGAVFNLADAPPPPSSTASAAPPSAAAAPPSPAPPEAPAAADAASADAAPAPSAEHMDAAAYARRGSASASRHDYPHAIADLTRATKLAPGEAGYFYERGLAYRASGAPDQALADFSEAIRLKPDDVPARMARAQLRAARRDPVEDIVSDLDAVDRAAAPESEVRLPLGDLYQHAHSYLAAIVQYDRWIDSHHADDVLMPRALNNRCWVQALLGEELERALADCNAALRARPKTASFLDSRGLVYLRRGDYDKAIADYDAALALNPNLAWALYGRGLAKQRRGQAAAGQTDIAAAVARSPKIAEEAAAHGISP